MRKSDILSVGLAGLVGLTNQTYAQPETAHEQKQEARQEAKSYTLDDYVNVVIKIESNFDAKAERYEPSLDDYSIGLGQILTKTAKDIEKRHPELPRLGENRDEIRNNLFNPETNRAYTTTLFKEELDFYCNPYLAVAAYNSGHLTPRNARCQEQLNELCGTKLVTDGIIGPCSAEIVKRFQQENGLDADGIIGPKTHSRLQEIWAMNFPYKANPKGIIPQNSITPYHVKKFKITLEVTKGR